MSVVWKYYPLSDVQYRTLPVTENNLLKPIVTLDDVDIVVKQTMSERIRFQTPGNSNFQIVPVIFYNENDRLKTMKESPFIILKPHVPEQVTDYVLTDTQTVIPVDNPDNQVYYNSAATWYKMAYTITIGCDTWPLYRRLCSFLKDGLFGQIYGQRRIQTNDQDGETHYRELKIESENSSEDYERNYFQFDLDISFEILLNIQEWTSLPRLTDVEFTVKNEVGLNIDSVQVVSDTIIDTNQKIGIVTTKE